LNKSKLSKTLKVYKNVDRIEEIKTFRVFLKDLSDDEYEALDQYDKLLNDMIRDLGVFSPVDARACRDEDQLEFIDIIFPTHISR
jgi:hypothetical protein